MKKLLTLFTLVLLLASTNSALAMTPYERAVALMSTINSPQVVTPYQLASSSTTCLDLTDNLSRGMSDETNANGLVRKLQNFLYPKYLAEPATGYFGVLTEAAVIKFQEEYSLVPAVGFVGGLTRAKIKELTCGGTGTQAREKVAAAPSSAAPAYNPNAPWWLAPTPTPTTGAPAPTPVPTNPPTPTATSTPPTNCDQYAGVIPGETRKVSVQQRNFQSYAFSGAYPVSNLAETQLRQMRGDIGFALTMGARGTGNWNRNTIPSGTALAYKFKTSEYNYPIYYTLTATDHPGSAQGVILSSVSLCPGDFTSPAVLAQKGGNDVNNLYGDGMFRNCVNYGTQVGVQFPFGVGYPGGYICNLEPNKTYYLNITAGFAGGGDKGFYTPHIGTFDGTSATAGTEMSVDFTMRQDGHSMAAGGVGDNTWTTEIIKNKSEFYTELRRILRLWNNDWSNNAPTTAFPLKVQ